MGYKVIQAFTDLKDDNRVYRVGDVYDGTDEERIKELLSKKSNGRHESLIGVSLIESDGENLPNEEVDIHEEVKKPKKAKK